MNIDWQKIRAEFPALARWTYLNTATYGQMPRCSADAIARHSEHRDELACTDFLDWYADTAGIRASIARLIHASPDDIAFVPNAAAALATVLAGIAPQAGENIVTLDDDFPNYQYLSAARKTTWPAFYESVDERTRLVALSEVNYATGIRLPVAEISSFLAARKIPLFVDATQNLGALMCDVRKTPVDVLTVHAYKWMVSPTGAGFMYISPEFRKTLPPSIIGWRSHRDWRNVDNLHNGIPEFADSAEKYEGGGLPFHLLYGMAASADMLLAIGAERIEQRVLNLAAQCRAILRDLGADAPETGSQIVCARFSGRDSSEIARKLRENRIVISARQGNLRISPHFYNNEEDLDRLRQSLS